MIDLLIKIMAVYFLFVFIFGSEDTKIHSAIIFLSCFVVVFFPMEKATTQEAYIASSFTILCHSMPHYGNIKLNKSTNWFFL